MTQLNKSFIQGVILAAALCLLSISTSVSSISAQNATWTKEETAIREQIRHLRDLPDDLRVRTTKQLAMDIRRLTKTPRKVGLATALANLSTEGDLEVGTSLAESLRENPLPVTGNEPAFEYVELATLARYEHVQVSLENPQYAAALAQLQKEDESRQQTDFTLNDLAGKELDAKVASRQGCAREFLGHVVFAVP